MAVGARRWMTGLLGGLLVCAGCGTFTARPPVLANPETGDNGQALLLDDIQVITNDMDLTDLEKRQALRDMGILDEDLLDALIAFPQ